jgi:protein TonB
MQVTNIPTADVLDIIFDGRNKQYGAYQLRKNYNSRLSKALLLTAAFAALAFLGSVFAGFKKSDNNNLIEVEGHILSQVQTETPIVTPPPPPALVPPPPPVNTIRFTAPVVVDDELVDPNETIETIDDNQAIGSETIKSDNASAIVQAPIEEHHTGVFEAPKQDDDDKVHLTVENEAEFPGGNAAWTRYLQKALNNYNVSDEGAPAGSYKIWVRFIVSKDGKVSDVKAETNFGYGMEVRAVQAIRNGPDWKPALQNGHHVNAYRKQPVVYVVEEQ